MQRSEDEPVNPELPPIPQGAADTWSVRTILRALPIHYSQVYGGLVGNSLTRELNFKTNFCFWLFVELLWFGLQLAFNDVIYLHTDHIGTWTKWQVVLLIGASHFIQQLFQAFFLVNCSTLADSVHSGKLDFMLLFPINVRFLVSCRQLDLGGFISAGSGLAVVIYAAKQLHLAPSFCVCLLFTVLCLAAVIVHYSLMFLMASVSFWSVRAQGILMAYYNLFSIARIPDVAFRGASRVIFTLGVPMLLVANVPVKVLASKLESPAEISLLLAMAFVCFLASELVWRLALRHYTSASS
jgi:ABC-2 type transport system permease protein